MVWLERIAFLLAGVAVAAGIYFLVGPEAIEKSDLAGILANVVGAGLGGLISVGLALKMFDRERAEARKDREAASIEFDQHKIKERALAIREALRYVRAIRECIDGAHATTINNSMRILRQLREAANLSGRALEDVNLTDFPLRLVMEDSIQIGRSTASQIEQELAQSEVQDANQTVPHVDAICATGLAAIDQLIHTYTTIRSTPQI